MTRQEAVVLSYIEWVRLIGGGAIRLNENRIVRWCSRRADPTEVVADLMMGAPDLGTSANSFILVMLEPEVLERVRAVGVSLGKRLKLDAVRSFHSFGDTALVIHRHDAKAAGVEIARTPLADGWVSWVAAVEAAERRARGEALLAIFGVPRCDYFSDGIRRLDERERCIAFDDIVRSRDSMFFGWACVLNSQKVGSGVAPNLPLDVKAEAERLRSDYNVDQPFLAQAPRLCAFVASLAAEGERPTDLLVMASLKQHERYVIKREGGALDVPSLVEDILVLEALDAGAAGLLIEALGERLPGELIQTMKMRGVSRSLGTKGGAASVDDRVGSARGNSDYIEVAAPIDQSMSVERIEIAASIERCPLRASINEQPSDELVLNASDVYDDSQNIAHDQVIAGEPQEPEVALGCSLSQKSASTNRPPDEELFSLSTTPDADTRADAVASADPAVRKKKEVAANRKTKTGVSPSKSKRTPKPKEQPSLLDLSEAQTLKQE